MMIIIGNMTLVVMLDLINIIGMEVKTMQLLHTVLTLFEIEIQITNL